MLKRVFNSSSIDEVQAILPYGHHKSNGAKQKVQKQNPGVLMLLEWKGKDFQGTNFELQISTIKLIIGLGQLFFS